jgi:hypothetical protein
MGSKFKIYALTALLIVVILLSAYLIVFQSYHHGATWLAALCVVLLFASILILQFLWIDVNPDSFWSSNVRTLAVVIIMIPMVYGLTKAENNYENTSIQAHGINATEVITYTYKTSAKNSGTHYHAVYQYVVNGQTYTHTLTESENIFNVGDTVHIIYSTEHPNMDKVIAYKQRQSNYLTHRHNSTNM